VAAEGALAPIDDGLQPGRVRRHCVKYRRSSVNAPVFRKGPDNQIPIFGKRGLQMAPDEAAGGRDRKRRARYYR
jgi:hypothetical protein